MINRGDILQLVSKFKNFNNVDTGERKVWYPSEAALKTITGPFPRDCIIDVERGVLGKIVGDQLVTIGITDQAVWI